MIKYAARIEVGLYEQRIGFTVEYTDGERAHVLFATAIAKEVAEKLLRLVAEVEYIERQLGAPSDGINVKESIKVELTPPSSPPGNLGIDQGDGLTVGD